MASKHVGNLVYKKTGASRTEMHEQQSPLTELLQQLPGAPAPREPMSAMIESPVMCDLGRPYTDDPSELIIRFFGE